MCGVPAASISLLANQMRAADHSAAAAAAVIMPMATAINVDTCSRLWCTKQQLLAYKTTTAVQDNSQRTTRPDRYCT